MSTKFVSRFVIVIMVSLFMSGCLTTEYKEYRLKLNSDGSGSGVIKYVNIVSEEDEGKDVSFTDFGELISDYLEGTTFEEDNPHYSVTNKELFIENDQLCGRIEFTFEDYRKIDFFRYEDCECSPLMLYLGSLSETMIESNGDSFGDSVEIPIIYWQPDKTDIYYKTRVKEDMSDARSLTAHYKTWQENN